MRFIESIAVLFGASAAVSAPFDHATQKKQLEDLLAAARPFAEIMLTKHGEFIPYGATMALGGKITDIGSDTGVQNPKSVDVIAIMKEAYRRDGASGKLLACAVVYDVRIVPPGQSEKSDAVAVELEHRDGMSVIIYYPYHLGPDKKVVFGELFATHGADDIFPRKKEG